MKIKKIGYGVAAFLVFILGVGIVAPLFLNINSWKAKIIAEASKALGREVRINGDIRFMLLPSPSVGVYDVSLANVPGAADQELARIEKLKVNIALIPLLSRQVRVTHILLSHPHIHLETLKNGQQNWNISLNSSSPSPESGKSKQQETIPKEEKNSIEVQIDSIELIGGEVSLRTPDSLYVMSDLTAHIAAESMKGPFKADGFFKLNHQDFRFKIKSREISEDTPVKIAIDASGTDLEIEGILRQDYRVFNGDILFKTDGKSLENLLGAIVRDVHLPKFINGPIQINGHMNASRSGIELKNLLLSLDKEKIDGNISVNFSPLSVQGDIHGIPGDTVLNLSMKPVENARTGQMRLTSKSPARLFAWFDEKNVKIPAFLDGLARIEGDFILKNHLLNLKNLVFAVNQTFLKGQLDCDLKKNKHEYNLTASGLMPVATFLGIPLRRDPGILSINGKTHFHDQKATTETTVKLSGIQLLFKGTGSANKNPEIKGVLDIQSRNATDFLSLFNEGPCSFRRVKITASVTASEGTTDVSGLNALIGVGGATLQANGNINLQTGKEKPFVNVDLHLGETSLDALFPVAVEKTRENKEPQIILVANRRENPGSRTPSSEKWSSSTMDLSFLNRVDGQFRLAISRLSKGNLVFRDIEANGSLAGGILDFPAIRSSFFNGNMSAGFRLDVTSTPSWTTRIGIKDANIQPIFQNASDIGIANGTMNATANLKGAGKSIREWIGSLSGTLAFEVINGAFAGFDLNALGNRLKNLRTPGDFLELFRSSMQKGKTTFQECRGALSLEKGIATIQKLILKSDAGQGSAVGQINLPAYLMDITSQFQLAAIPELPPFRMRMAGPLDQPSRDFDIQSLQKYMIENVVSAFLKKGSLKGNIIENILGNTPAGKTESNKKTGSGKSQSENSSQIPSDIAKEPEKVIENVLKGLFK